MAVAHPHKCQYIHPSSQDPHTYMKHLLAIRSCAKDDSTWREIFQTLVQKLCEKCNLEDRTYVSVEEQVCIFLYTISKNASNRTVQDIFQHSGSTVSYYFRVVLNEITSLSCNYIRLPSLHPHRILRQQKFAYFQVLLMLCFDMGNSY